MKLYKCADCGKFRSPKELYIYTEYGNSFDIEPSEPKFICSKCYSKSKELINKISWIKPKLLKD